MLRCLDVFNVERDEGCKRLWQLTILTLIICTFAYPPPCQSVQLARLRLQKTTGSRLHHSHEMEGGQVPIILMTLRIGEITTIRFGCQKVNSFLKLIVGLESHYFLSSLRGEALGKRLDYLID